LVVREGLAGMRQRISTTARYGGLTRGPRIIGPETRRALQEIFDEIQSGKFSVEWKDERSRGGPLLDRLLREEAAHPLEESGRRIRRSSPQDVDSPGENS